MTKLLEKWKLVCATIAALVTLGWATHAYLGRYAEAANVEEITQKVIIVERQIDKIVIDIGWIRDMLEKGQCK